MRAFPFQRLGRALRVREPERDAVVMRDGEANTLRGERQSADGRWHLEHALGTLAAARKRLLARRPRDRAVRADRHMVDPAALAVGGHHGAVALLRRSTPPCRRRRRSRCGRRRRSSTGWRRRAPPPCARRPFSERTAVLSSPSTNTAVWPRKCAATTGASALNGRVRSTTEGISLLVSVTAQSALFLGMQVYGDRAHTARMRAALEGGQRLEPVRGRAVPLFLRSTGTIMGRAALSRRWQTCYQLPHELDIDYVSGLWYRICILAQRGVF